jgi:hypothetical protein
VDRLGRGFSLDDRDVGMDVTGYDALPDPEDARADGSPREKLPPGHRYFSDCQKETAARQIAWSMRTGGVDSWFITFTFKTYVSEARAWRMVNAWFSSLSQCYRDKINAYRSNGPRWVVAQEWQKRNVIHFHAILSGVRLDELSRKRWEHRWSGIGGGYARIYAGREKAAPYLAKYVGKTDTRDSELRRGGSWRGMTPPRSVGCCQA